MTNVSSCFVKLVVVGKTKCFAAAAFGLGVVGFAVVGLGMKQTIWKYL